MKQIINLPFPARLTRNSYALISVVDPEGRPKILTVKPGGEKKNWLRCEWGRDGGGRPIALISVDLTTEREAAGAVFLKDAYLAEEWPEGWALWESYVREQYFVEIANKQGGKSLVRRERPAYRGHFPPELLPKKVQEMAANAEVTRKGPRWEAPEGVVHPADAEEPKSKRRPKAAG